MAAITYGTHGSDRRKEDFRDLGQEGRFLVARFWDAMVEARMRQA